MPPSDDQEFRQRVEEALRTIGASSNLLAKRELTLFTDAADLTVAHVSRSGREHLLIPAAAEQWGCMREIADKEGVVLVMISGYRGFDRQLQLIQEKLAEGHHVDEILSVMAPPGCSEHHTGRAVDVGTPGCEPLSENFEHTDAFQWLSSRAEEYGFRMSYPRNNRMGYRYEPWHWYYWPT